MRGVLTLFEGVATGAADGYARMAGRPAAVLLHLGPGLGNGLANLHNARRAGPRCVTSSATHATGHERYDAPLESDIGALAGHGVGLGARQRRAGRRGRTPPSARWRRPARGQVATLVLPADVSLVRGRRSARRPRPGAPFPPARPGARGRPRRAALRRARRGAAPRRRGVPRRGDGRRGRVAAATGARLLTETFPARAGARRRPARRGRLAYFAEQAPSSSTGRRRLVLAGRAVAGVVLRLPRRARRPRPDGVHGASGWPTRRPTRRRRLEALARRGWHRTPCVDAGAARPPEPAHRPARRRGRCAPRSARLLPEDAIVVDEALTVRRRAARGAADGRPAHDWLTLTGGAIGQGPPAALGRGDRGPDRPVVARAGRRQRAVHVCRRCGRRPASSSTSRPC